MAYIIFCDKNDKRAKIKKIPRNYYKYLFWLAMLSSMVQAYFFLLPRGVKVGHIVYEKYVKF